MHMPLIGLQPAAGGGSGRTLDEWRTAAGHCRRPGRGRDLTAISRLDVYSIR
jgi:hypothetical protein